MSFTNRKSTITWELALFFALYIIMPEYCAIELSEKLPLITASRVVLVLLGLMMVIRRRADLLVLRRFRLKNWQLLITKDPVLRWGLFGYLVLLLITNMTFLLDIPSAAIKEIFVLAAEQYMLVWLLTMTVDTREKLQQCLKVLVYTSGVVALVTIIGVILDVNLFHYLKTTQREMLMSTYYRLGMLRAEAGFGHPVFYGAFCTVILPINMFFLEKSERRGERVALSGCMVFNLLGLVLSNSRGSLIAFVGLMLLMLPIKLIMKLGKKNILNYIAIAAATAVMLVVVTGASPAGSGVLQNITNSVIHVVFPEWGYPTVSDPSSSDPSVSDPSVSDPSTMKPAEDYGENENGLRSRLVQLTGIEWTLKHEPIFGFGPGAHNRRELKYEFKEDNWWATGSVDVGLVAVIGQYGLVGLLGYTMLYGSVLLTLLRKKMWKDPLMMMFFFSFTGIILCLLSISSMERTMWVLIGLFVCLVNIKETPTVKEVAS